MYRPTNIYTASTPISRSRVLVISRPEYFPDPPKLEDADLPSNQSPPQGISTRDQRQIPKLDRLRYVQCRRSDPALSHRDKICYSYPRRRKCSGNSAILNGCTYAYMKRNRRESRRSCGTLSLKLRVVYLPSRSYFRAYIASSALKKKNRLKYLQHLQM